MVISSVVIKRAMTSAFTTITFVTAVCAPFFFVCEGQQCPPSGDPPRVRNVVEPAGPPQFHKPR